MDRAAKGIPATGLEEERQRTASRKAYTSARQTLPSFREVILQGHLRRIKYSHFMQILPQHLHEAIDSAPYDGPVEPQRPTASSPKYRSAQPVSRLAPSVQEQGRGRRIPSFSEGFSGYGDDHRNSPPPSARSRRPSLSSHSPNSPGSPPQSTHPYHSPSSSSYRTYQSSPSLPPLREVQSGSEARHADERQPGGAVSQYPNSYVYGSRAVAEHEGSSYSQRSHGLPTVASGYPHSNGHARGSVPIVPRQDRYSPGSYSTDASMSAYSRPYPNVGYPQHMASRPEDASFGSGSLDPTDPRNKRRRGNLPKPVTDILRGWFHEHLDHPYPSEEDKQVFMAQTGLTMSQVRMSHSQAEVVLTC